MTNDREELYYSYSSYLKEKYGQKVYKLPVNLPVSCPNRTDGKGCTFCAAEGTGFEAAPAAFSITDQLKDTRKKIEARYHAHKYIAYFQNYTNTFLPLAQLISCMEEAAGVPDIVEIVLSTRPDCVNDDYLDAFCRFREQHGPDVSLEYGLQTVNYHTLAAVNRGHGLAEFIDAVLRSSSRKIPVCAHLILNLPGDTMEDVKESARILSALPIQMVKLHSLYVPKTSPMAEAYLAGDLPICSRDEYLERLTEFIALLRPDIIVERLFSRIPEKDAAFSNWGVSWWKLQDEWKERMRRKGWVQGIHFDYLNGAALRHL